MLRGDVNTLEHHPGIPLIDETYLLDVGKTCLFLYPQLNRNGIVGHCSKIIYGRICHCNLQTFVRRETGKRNQSPWMLLSKAAFMGGVISL